MREIDAMRLMWRIWGVSGDVQCCECDKSLDFHPNHCAHLLSKGSFKKYRTRLINIIPLCFNCHYQFDSGSAKGTRKDMKIWSWVEDIIFKLKREYHQWS